MEQAVASAQQTISGINTDTQAMPRNIFHSTSMAIDSHVPDKIKAKIWNSEFIDFNSLLPSIGNNKFQLSFKNLDGSNSPSICLEPFTKSQKILNINNWLQAFHVFVGVYTRRFPAEAPGLMNYGEIVQDLASRGFNWKFYDENYRYLHQSSASVLPWGSIHWELWLRSQSSNSTVEKRPSSNGPLKTGEKVRVPHGTRSTIGSNILFNLFFDNFEQKGTIRPKKWLLV